MTTHSIAALVVLTALVTACDSSITGAPAMDAGHSSDLGGHADLGSTGDMSTATDSNVPLDLGFDPDAGSPLEGDYYVATDGDDSNAGTIDAPFRTLTRLNDALIALGADAAGKTAYIRGGTYLSDAGNGAAVHFTLQDLHGTAGNPVRIWAYPGERPIFSCANITPTYEYPFVFYLLSSSYVHLKGLTFTMLKQVASGVGISRGVNIAGVDHSTIELIEVSNIGGAGFIVSEDGAGVPSTFNHILNCDSHHNGDGLADPAFPEYGSWNTGDGFGNSGGDTSSDNVYEGCRAWLNSDDGYDWFDWAGARVTLNNCWAFWNGIKPWGTTTAQPDPTMMTTEDPSVFFDVEGYVVSPGAGEGFKLGGYGGSGPPAAPTVLKKLLNGCVAFENIGTGYSENMQAEHGHQMQFWNNIAYANGNDGFGYGTGRSVGIAHIFRNNWAYGNNRIASGGDWAYDGLPDNISHNYWATTYGGIDYGNLSGTITITDADFRSVSSLGAAGPRQADGSLPNLDFLRLVGGSDLIDHGIDVGLPFNGANPDVGAYEH